MKKKVTACFALLAVGALALALPALAQQTIGGHDETTEDHTLAQWGAAAAANPGVVVGATGAHLLITEVGWRGLNSATLADSTEYVEIYNPTAAVVVLSNCYISDVNGYSALPVSGLVSLATSTTDFAMRFPAGASIGPGGVKVIAIDGGRYRRGTGVDADYMMYNAGGGLTTAVSMIDVGTGAGAGYPSFGSFTNTAEFVWLFFWDQVSDLVCDLDLVYWGAGTGANLPVLKIATTCQDGPDANAIASCYNVDAGNVAGGFTKGLVAPASGAGTRQRTGAEGAEGALPGNGCVPGGPTPTRGATWGQVKVLYR